MSDLEIHPIRVPRREWLKPTYWMHQHGKGPTSLSAPPSECEAMDQIERSGGPASPSSAGVAGRPGLHLVVLGHVDAGAGPSECGMRFTTLVFTHASHPLSLQGRAL